MEEKNITNEKSESEIIEEQNEKIKNLENKINELLQALVSNKDVDKNEESQDVTIVSLCNGILVLSTEGYGRGDVYVFRKFGEEKVVDRADAKRIIRNNLSFFQKGKAYITDQKLIESEKYKDIQYGIKLGYKNIGFNGQFYTFPYFLTFLLKRFSF